jgi:hypothetical protein
MEDTMKRLDSSLLWGLLLVGGGVLLLLQNLGWLGQSAVSVVWATLFLAAGAVFLVALANDRRLWWAGIPGFGLVGLGMAAFLGRLFPVGMRSITGALFLGGLGCGFWVIYFLRREQWWAIIPGGVFFTLALQAALPSVLRGRESGVLFFVGLAATFFLVYLLPTPRGRMTWALIPALALLALAVLTMPSLQYIALFGWPVALIGFGAYLLYRALRRPAASGNLPSPPSSSGDERPMRLGG